MELREVPVAPQTAEREMHPCVTPNTPGTVSQRWGPLVWSWFWILLVAFERGRTDLLVWNATFDGVFIVLLSGHCSDRYCSYCLFTCLWTFVYVFRAFNERQTLLCHMIDQPVHNYFVIVAA